MREAHASLTAVEPWLRELASGGAERSPRRQALLLGTAWLAEGERAAAVGSVTRLLATDAGVPTVGEILALDPLLVGVAARATQACGAAANPWIDTLAEAAAALPDERDQPPLFAAVLEATGIAGRRRLPTTQPTRPPLLTADARAWHGAALSVGAASAFGRRPPVRADVDALRLWLAAALRRYDLQVAAALVRALLWLGRRAVAPVEHALGFLVRHQHPGGWFGYLGPELAEHPLADDPRELQCAVHLPTALTVCWALRQSLSDVPVL